MHDIELQNQLAAQRALFDAMAEAGVCLVQIEKGRIVGANDAIAQELGYSSDEMMASPTFLSYVAPEDREWMAERHRELLAGKAVSRRYDVTLQRKDGSRRPYSASIAPISGTTRTLVALVDITERREYETRLEFQATRDPLTHLPNRMLLHRHLENALKHAASMNEQAALLFIDIDNFKGINDTIGRTCGDQLLKAIADRMEKTMPGSDAVARIAGDKFAAFINGTAKAIDVANLAGVLRHAIAMPHYVDGQEITVSCCIGITLFPGDGKDADTLLRNADTALKHAKEKGANNFQFFTAEMDRAVRRRIEISSRLRRALQLAEFSLHYQPRVALPDGTVTGVEALVRWNSSCIGPVSPAEFIPIAESNGMIVEIGKWVLRTACRQGAQWFNQGMPVTMAVNLSARQLRDTDIVAFVRSALDESGLPPPLLELEITESMLMHDAEATLRTLTTLKNMGISLAIDDFGTGYSSLAYLKRFPLDYLKVDRSFVRDVPHDANDVAIVHAIIAMAHSLGLQVIAEGVETSAQLDYLQQNGCDQVQGYYFSSPIPPECVAPLLQRRRLTGPAGMCTTACPRKDAPSSFNLDPVIECRR